MQNEFEPIEIQTPTGANSKKRMAISVICVLLVAILAVTAALLVKTYVISTFIVDGTSMYPTLDGGNGALTEGNSDRERTNGEVLYLNKLAKIKRGDIVVFTSPASDLINIDGSPQTLVKRVIAVGGDHLQIIDNVVYLNDQVLTENYINADGMDTPNIDVYVKDGYIFCMGDNRNNSRDCRNFGQVSLDNVIGRCFAIKGLNNKLRWVK